MTLQAVEPIRVTVPPQDGWIPPEEQPVGCEIPGCSSRGNQYHHIIRRSFTAGPKDWVSIDGSVLWNKMWVCTTCHDYINSHRLWVKYETGEGWVVWERASRTVQIGDRRWITHPKSGSDFVKIGTVGERSSS